jgi:hypothetical protein
VQKEDRRLAPFFVLVALILATRRVDGMIAANIGRKALFMSHFCELRIAVLPYRVIFSPWPTP